MMDIKRKLIEKIDDSTLLNQLTELVSESNHAVTLEFTPDQISKVEESQQQIKNGESHVLGSIYLTTLIFLGYFSTDCHTQTQH